MDHHSTDGTVAAVEPYLGRGLVGIERFPGRSPAPGTDTTRFTLGAIMRRKEQLACELPADWFINHDADEFRDSPWAHLDLKGAIRAADRSGFNAIDFEVLNFRPTHDRFQPGYPVRDAFQFYERGQISNNAQIRCWKRALGPVDLASTGGHEAIFAGRRVFPVRFILRHYPIRGQAHGERKVFQERLPRFDKDERLRGWHAHYDRFRQGQSFLRVPQTLTFYDPETVRFDLLLRHREVEELSQATAESRRTLDEALARVVALETELAEQHSEVARQREELRKQADEHRQLLAQISQLHASRSWRWTAPLRAASRFIRGRVSGVPRRSGTVIDVIAGQEFPRLQGMGCPFCGRVREPRELLVQFGMKAMVAECTACRIG